MNRKRIILIAIFLMDICLNISSQEGYKILFLNTETIKVGQRELHVGDTLQDNEPIYWSNESQAMKVINLKNHKQRVIPADMELLQNKLSLSDILSDIHTLAVRDGQIMTIFQLRNDIGDEILLADTVQLDVNIPIDDEHYFFVAYHNGSELIYKKLPQKEKQFIIDRSLFIVDGVSVEPFSTSIRIYYQNGDSRELVSDECKLIVIPLKI